MHSEMLSQAAPEKTMYFTHGRHTKCHDKNIHTYNETLGHVMAHIVSHTEEYVVATTYTQNAADLQSTSPTCVFTLLFIEGYGSVHRHMFRHSTCGVTSPYACKMPKIVTHSHTLSLHRRSHRTYNTTSPPPKTTHFTHEPHFPTHTPTQHHPLLPFPKTRNNRDCETSFCSRRERNFSKRCQSKCTEICKACLREMCMQYTKSMNTRNIQTYKTQIHMHIYLYLCVHTYNKHQESRGLQRQTSLRGSLRTKCPCLKSKKHTYTTTPTHSRGCTQCILGIAK